MPLWRGAGGRGGLAQRLGDEPMLINISTRKFRRAMRLLQGDVPGECRGLPLEMGCLLGVCSAVYARIICRNR
jgi:hypothetical protein